MNFKNRNGFLLLEALFATVIVGMIMGPLFMTQNSILTHLSSGFAQVERLFVAKHFLIQTVITCKEMQGSEKSLEKKEINPETNMIFTLEPIPKESSLSKVKNIFLAKVQFSWIIWASSGRSDTVCVVKYIPPPPPENKAPPENKK
jgi:hypothetical protein